MTKTKKILIGIALTPVVIFGLMVFIGLCIQASPGYRPPPERPTHCVTAVPAIGAVVFFNEQELINCARFGDSEDQFNCLWNRFGELHEPTDSAPGAWGMSQGVAYEEVRRTSYGTVLVRCPDFTGWVAASHVKPIACP